MGVAGFFRMFVEERKGGLEVAPGLAARICETLARGDAACGWIAFIGATSGLALCRVPDDAARDILATPETLIAGVFAASDDDIDERLSATACLRQVELFVRARKRSDYDLEAVGVLTTTLVSLIAAACSSTSRAPAGRDVQVEQGSAGATAAGTMGTAGAAASVTTGGNRDAGNAGAARPHCAIRALLGFHGLSSFAFIVTGTDGSAYAGRVVVRVTP